MRDWVFLGCPAIIISLFVWGAVHPRSHWRVTRSWRSWLEEEPSAGLLLFHRLLNIAGLVVLAYFFIFEFPALLD